MSSSINVYLMADGIHELGSNTTSGAFRRMNAYILIKPAYCSEYPKMPFCCKEKHIKVTLKQKMVSIFIAGTLRIEGLYIRDINYSAQSEYYGEADLTSGIPFTRLKGLGLITIQHFHDDPDPKRAHVIIENIRLSKVRIGNRKSGIEIAFLRIGHVPHETVIRDSSFEDIYFTGGLIDSDGDSDNRALLTALEASDPRSFQNRMRNQNYSERLSVSNCTFANIDTKNKEPPDHIVTGYGLIYLSTGHPSSTFTFDDNTLKNVNLTSGSSLFSFLLYSPHRQLCLRSK